MELLGFLAEDSVVAALRAAGCVYPEDEAAILCEAAGTSEELARMLAHRVAGFPLECIVGWAGFRGLRIAVAAGVFVPRRRTEFLVERAVAVLRSGDRAPGSSPPRLPIVLDLCCGSGAVGAALVHERGALELHAADIDPAAVACAARNLKALKGHAHCGDLFLAIPSRLRGKVDVIVANAPYVPTAEIAFMPAEARLHEPDAALNGGVDGLEIQGRIAAQAPAWLRPGGSLLMETSTRQAAASAGIMVAHGFSVTIAHSEDLDGTVVTGCGPSLAATVHKPRESG
ncbi:hypothetical protein AOC05_08975 [Arthrobacter alpinus]|uniref:peptide chain release factor N(5)-glutamine methyltransferase n=1 Tax=Arthrobacter alpinus TaxID=656366 RepID=A0A0M4R1N1_9MICC|nr:MULTISPECIES: putative protein N(5)-glutamine methyltransferase [Arthrobacter]ALE94114.1 hypothetical protein AOC05_08975 [Arthrobacter alpinus]